MGIARQEVYVRFRILVSLSVFFLALSPASASKGAAEKPLVEALPKLSLPARDFPLRLDTGGVFRIGSRLHYLVIEGIPGDSWLRSVSFSEDGREVKTWRVPRALWYLPPVVGGKKAWIIAGAGNGVRQEADILLIRASDGEVVGSIHYQGVWDFMPMRPHSIATFREPGSDSLLLFITPPMHSVAEAYRVSAEGKPTQLWRTGGIEYYDPQWLKVIDLAPWGPTLVVDSGGVLYFFDVSDGSLRGKIKYFDGMTLHIDTGLVSLTAAGEQRLELIRAAASPYAEFAGRYLLDLKNWSAEKVWEKSYGGEGLSDKPMNLAVAPALLRGPKGEDFLLLQFDKPGNSEAGDQPKKTVRVIAAETGEEFWEAPGELALATRRFFVLDQGGRQSLVTLDGEAKVLPLPGNLVLLRRGYPLLLDQPTDDSPRVFYDTEGQLLFLDEEGRSLRYFRAKPPQDYRFVAAIEAEQQALIAYWNDRDCLLALYSPDTKQAASVYKVPSAFRWTAAGDRETDLVTVGQWEGDSPAILLEHRYLLASRTYCAMPLSGTPSTTFESALSPLFLSLGMDTVAVVIDPQYPPVLKRVSAMGAETIWPLTLPLWDPQLRLVEHTGGKHRLYLHCYQLLQMLELDASGEITLLWEQHFPHQCSRAPLIYDYNGDGHNDVITMLDEQLHCFDGNSGVSLRSVSNYEHWAGTPVKGLRADGKPLLILTAEALGAYDWDSFELLWSAQSELERTYGSSPSLLLDFDGDGGTDIIRRVAADRCVIYDGETGSHLAEVSFPAMEGSSARVLLASFRPGSGSQNESAVIALAGSLAIVRADVSQATSPARPSSTFFNWPGEEIRQVEMLAADGSQVLVETGKSLRLLNVARGRVTWELRKPADYRGWMADVRSGFLYAIRASSADEVSLASGRVIRKVNLGAECTEVVSIGRDRCVLVLADGTGRLLATGDLSRQEKMTPPPAGEARKAPR
jgi:hypothetical protein